MVDHNPILSTLSPVGQFIWKLSFWVCSVTGLYLVVSITTYTHSHFPIEGLNKLRKIQSYK